MSNWHRAAAGLVALTTLVALSGCAARAPLPLGEKLAARLIHAHMKPDAAINFDTLVGGDWTQATIVCGPVSGRDIDKALGFDWVGPTTTQPANQSMMLFSNPVRVLHRIVVENDDVHGQAEFSPCFTPSSRNPSGEREIKQVIVVARVNSRITLHNDQTDLPWSLWYITSTERAKLQVESGD
jgi:hypothetical protein